MTPPAPSLQSGRPWPLGAHWDGQGVNFAVFSAEAERIELCLFDESGARQLSCTALPGRSHDVWHGYLPGAKAGLVYGLRAHGAWSIQHGQRFNPFKLLLDPYAREIVGQFAWSDLHFGGEPDHPERMDRRDNAGPALKARVTHDVFDWGDDQPPRWGPADSVLYELHVKGFTRMHPGVPADLRGTYAGLASDAAIAHLQRLGISAVSLLPVHQAVDEQRLVKMGLSNYWGYNTVGFFCPDPRLAAAKEGAGVRDEFRRMVRRLHQAGIEVILDVVFNHSCETDERGPTLHLRGLDNRNYYRLPYAYPELYENDTGTGNTLDLRHPRVLQMVTDSLRYWVQDMHVDGFRFDLATVLGRGSHGFDRNAPFFHAVAQCPVLSRVKMIAEPWDIGSGGYQVGGFPAGWMEWNDRYRDTVRSFWLRGTTDCGELARRLSASSDMFQARGRTPAESVNFIVAHDGFTLADLLRYNEKHNEANGEDNRDGHSHNHSWNCGAEGASDDRQVVALRARLARALLATLLLSQGTPMLCAGDELGHTQGGNNNAYCQDNETSWIDWSQADASLQKFTVHVLTLRRSLLPLANRWYSGQVGVDGLADLAWLRADGGAMHDSDWHDPAHRVLGALVGVQGKAVAPLLLLINGSAADAPFALPAGFAWSARLDSAQPDGQVSWSSASAATPYPLAARSVVLLVAEPTR